jgi:hypothetical protein
VDAADSCAWSASSAADWITLTSGASGSGPGEIRYSVAPASGSERTGIIHVGDEDVTIAQGADCGLSVSPPALSFGAAAGTGHVDVSGADGCGWTAESRSDWLTVTSGARGDGSGRVTLAVAANSGPERTGSLAVAGRSVAVTQAGGCRYDVSPSAVTLPGTGGGASASISTADACRWSATASDSWISVSPVSGTGSAALEISAGPNLGEARSGTVTAGGHKITISQPSSCTFVLAPPSADYSAGGGAGTVLVITTGTCSWTAVSHSSWVRVTVGATGDGNGLVQFKVDANTGPARTGHMTIAGADFAIRQSSP